MVVGPHHFASCSSPTHALGARTRGHMAHVVAFSRNLGGGNGRRRCSRRPWHAPPTWCPAFPPGVPEVKCSSSAQEACQWEPAQRHPSELLAAWGRPTGPVQETNTLPSAPHP